ncbi:chaplin [Streptomyces sp. NPDC006655]|uniref:chaplin n=1 Tax=Streptomyces sp. NPDC006655 TaxID=3156898 RepID=UPI003452E8BA
MKRVTRNGVIAVAAASGAMAVAVPAWADAGADGIAAGSPGVVSGNGIELPVHVPVNVCGDTVNVVGLLNPAAGNTCASEGGAAGGASGGTATSGGANARGTEQDSPGVVSGNGIELPVDLPVNVSGNSVDVVGVLNPALGNTSVNDSGDHPSPPKSTSPPTAQPPAPEPPKKHPAPEAHHPAAPPVTDAALAHTGTDLAGPAAAAAAALLLTGTALHRRFRPNRSR